MRISVSSARETDDDVSIQRRLDYFCIFPYFFLACLVHPDPDSMPSSARSAFQPAFVYWRGVCTPAVSWERAIIGYDNVQAIRY